jgi:hypothetical protein
MKGIPPPKIPIIIKLRHICEFNGNLDLFNFNKVILMISKAMEFLIMFKGRGWIPFTIRILFKNIEKPEINAANNAKNKPLDISISIYMFN